VFTMPGDVWREEKIVHNRREAPGKKYYLQLSILWKFTGACDARSHLFSSRLWSVEIVTAGPSRTLYFKSV
jgi:hypothetical protein